MLTIVIGLSPDQNTIANFRKNNPKAIRKVFHATVTLTKNFNQIGGKLPEKRKGQPLCTKLT
jgi:hypothetical protein